MNEIGGYFELELSKGNNVYHETDLVFKSGRSSLNFILAILQPSLVYIPFYTCNALLEPFETVHVKYAFYEINELLEPVKLPELKEGEYFLYINYFDIKRKTVTYLSEKYTDRLIVDCTQAFFMKGNGKSWFFNSCRKFFGVPDGSFLYVPDNVKAKGVQAKSEEYIIDHLLKRFNGHTSEGFSFFQKNEVLCGVNVIGMSKLTEFLLSNVSYNEVIEERWSNYTYLHKFYCKMNMLHADLFDNVPMIYPLLQKEIPARKFLHENNVFVPAFWKDVLDRNKNGYECERFLTEHLLAIPIDHRYNLDDMNRIVKFLK